MQHAKGDEGVQGSDQKSRATTRPTLRDKIFLDCINFKGQTLRTGKFPLRFLCTSPCPDPALPQVTGFIS